MAGKANRGRNRKGSQQNAVISTNQSPPSESSLHEASSSSQANGVIDANPEEKPKDDALLQQPTKQADIHLYPVSVKTPGGEKIELQLSPGDSVMDVRQFLLDAPETCFITCYDLLLHTKDGSSHVLEDYNDISEIADITSGGCYLEMISAQYDDRSIRAHLQQTKDLLSLSTLHSSLSTMFALQHENGNTSSVNIGDAAKVGLKELDSLVFMENISGSLNNLLSAPSKEIKSVESIVFSSFNPPPNHRRLLFGDLIYLDVVTLEGNNYCITGTTMNFYVNSSTGNIYDPRPNKAALEASTIVGLLQKISPKFKKAFREILNRKASAHPFENVQSVLPPNSWIGLYPPP
ncbi:hypothetical protein M569_09828, partial [Genlisea aurea]